MRLSACIALLVILLLPQPAAASAFSSDRLRIGVLTDGSGIYADLSGEGGLIAAEMAVRDFGGKVGGLPIELLFGDHRNRTGHALEIARAWLDAEKVDMILDLTNSAVALAVQELARTRNRITIATGASTPELTGAACSPTGVHYVYDSHAIAAATAAGMVERGGDSWFFLTADYPHGHGMEREIEQVVLASGGRVLGRVHHPIGISDFSGFVRAAQASGAKVLALANNGGDTIQLVRQAVALGLTAEDRRIAALSMFSAEVHKVGLAQAHGVIRTTAFYWDRNEATRAFARRYYEQTQRMPTMVQAGNYSAVTHYLRAVEAAGTDRAAAVMAKMRAMPIDDFFAAGGRIREDGRMVHDLYLVEVKKPDESQGPWDYFRILKTIPGEQAFRRLGEGGCKLVGRP